MRARRTAFPVRGLCSRPRRSGTRQCSGPARKRATIREASSRRAITHTTPTSKASGQRYDRECRSSVPIDPEGVVIESSAELPRPTYGIRDSKKQRSSDLRGRDSELTGPRCDKDRRAGLEECASDPVDDRFVELKPDDDKLSCCATENGKCLPCAEANRRTKTDRSTPRRSRAFEHLPSWRRDSLPIEADELKHVARRVPQNIPAVETLSFVSQDAIWCRPLTHQCPCVLTI